MGHWRRNFMAVLALASAGILAFSVGCDGAGGGGALPPDSGPDGPAVWDFGIPLWPCATPGEPCNTHDYCAVDAVCSADKRCVPRRIISCDDGLPCTDDQCTAAGGCAHKARPGYCALKAAPGATAGDSGPPEAGAADAGASQPRCFKAGELRPGNPCQRCDPDLDPTVWFELTGNACDDGDLCTRDDKCVYGQCQGAPYGLQCKDGLDCTLDTCDGKGGCVHSAAPGSCWIDGACYKGGETVVGPCALCTGGTAVTLLPGACLIAGQCYQQGQPSATGCGACDPAKSTTAFSPQSGQCTVAGKCYHQGVLHPGGCASCSPAGGGVWTPNGNGCLIQGACVKAGALDSTGCHACQPLLSTTSWSKVPGTCLINGTCHKDGDKSADGCSACDSSQSGTSWTLLSGLCKIGGSCFKSGQTSLDGCKVCDPARSSTAWSPVSGVCLLGGSCHKVGKDHPGGCATCAAGASGAAWLPKPGQCLIQDACYKAGATDATGCGACDPAKSSGAWTPLASVCAIGGKCYADGAKAPGGCAACDVATSKSGWTTLAGKCFIDGICYSQGFVHSKGCARCTPAKSQSAWTPVAGAQSAAYGFENGKAAGWTLSNSAITVGWNVSAKRASAGKYALYYGNPATGNYDSGAANSGTASVPAVTLTKNKKAGLVFSLYMDTEATASYDRLEVRVGGVKVWEKTSQVTMKKWQQVSVDLTAYAGKTVTVQFKFDTVDSIANATEGVYLDDVMIFHGC